MWTPNLTIWNNGWQKLTASDILARLDAANPVHAQHIARIECLKANGTSYSGEDYDVLSAALTASAERRLVA